MLAVDSTKTEFGPGSRTMKIVPRTKVVRSVMPYTVTLPVVAWFGWIRMDRFCY